MAFRILKNKLLHRGYPGVPVGDTVGTNIAINFAIIFLIFNLLSTNTHGQKRISVEINFPSNYNIDSLKFQTFEDGKRIDIRNLKKINNHSVVADFTFLGAFGQLIIQEPIILNDQKVYLDKIFYTNSKKSKISFQKLKKFESNSILAQPITYSISDFSSYQTKVYQTVEKENAELNTLYSILQRGVNEDSIFIFRKKISDKRKSILEKLISEIEKNKNNFGSILLLNHMVEYDYCLNDSLILSTINNIGKIYQNSLEITILRNSILKSKCLNSDTTILNQKRPEFTTRDTEGALFELKSTLGKKVILNFWATWCQPCLIELKELKKIHDEFPDIEILGVAWDNDLNKIKKYLSKFEIGWKIVLINENIIKTYNIKSIPKNLFINENGEIIEYFDEMVSYHQIVEAIKKNNWK